MESKKDQLRLYGRKFNPAALILWREQCGLSKAEMGGRMGYARNVCTAIIWRYETGKITPSPQTLMTMIKVLGCTIDDLAPNTEDNCDLKSTPPNKYTRKYIPKKEWNPSWRFGD